jgi:hypothetical protein
VAVKSGNQDLGFGGFKIGDSVEQIDRAEYATFDPHTHLHR